MNAHILPASELIENVKQLIGSKTPIPAAVCFDFFDTLVFRSVPPEDTKRLAGETLSEHLKNNLHAEDIYQLRSLLEQRLCRESREAGNDPEFNLVELAGAMHNLLQPLGLLDSQDDSNEFTNRIIEIELALEKKVQRVSKDLTDLLKYCHDKGIGTAIISDFYLPKQYFLELLSHHDLTDQVDHLFVSADQKVSKGHGGKLYQVVAKAIDCKPEQMIMIGDNPHADGVMATAQGLTAYCLERSSVAVTKKPETFRQFEKALQGNQAPFFGEMGLSLHWFISRLFLRALVDGRQDLFFCSKEGEFLQKLFISYQQLKFGRQLIDSHYLYVSRKATFICSLKPLEQESFDRLFVHYRDLSLIEFLQSLNFSEVQAAEICKDLQIDSATRHFDLKNHSDFKQLIQAPLFKDQYDRLRTQQQTNFLRYLSHFEVDLQKDGLALVDVGWKGSIQNNIFYALDEQVAVQGYYLGLLSPTEIRKKNKKTGILFHDVPTHSEYIHVFNNNRSLFEMVLGASHGSADGYYLGEQFVQEERDINISLIAVSENPEIPHIALIDLPEERELYATQIKPLQECYVRLHEALTKLSRKSATQFPDLAWVARKHARMVFKPNGGEVDLFSQLYHLENFGLFEFTAFDNPDHISFVQRVKNLWALKRDPAAYLETGTWPPIILRRLGLGFLTTLDGHKRFNRIFGSTR